MLIDNVEVVADRRIFDEAELKKYVDYVRENAVEKEPVKKVIVEMCADGKVDVDYYTQGEKFERIRRITGYLVGTLDRWNDAKRSEERERVKNL